MLIKEVFVMSTGLVGNIQNTDYSVMNTENYSSENGKKLTVFRK